MAPVVKMHTLGHDFVPDPIHAGGLRYHGMAPQVSLLKDQGIIEARAVHQSRTFEAGAHLHAGRGHPAGARADACHQRRHRRGPQGDRGGHAARSSSSTCAVTATSTSASYERYLAGELEDYELPEERIQHALETVPAI